MVPTVPVEPGLNGSVAITVSDVDTAEALRSGDVPVLATPRVLALCEEATVVALAGHLADGVTSVGMRVQLDHVQPTAVGGRVEASAVLEKVEGRRLTFVVQASDDRGTVAEGRVVRVLVERDRFLDKLR
jgi:fluoroacetyl-CoA thioesterase